MNYQIANEDELPRTLVPSLVHLINRHSGDTMFLFSLRTMCRFLTSCCHIPGSGSEVISRTMDRFAFPDDEADFQQLIKDHENGALSTQMLLGTISVIDRISASNTGTEN